MLNIRGITLANMAIFRPAGLSDDDSDSDEYGFQENSNRNYQQPPHNAQKHIELRLQEAIINGNLQLTQEITTCDLIRGVNMKLESGWTPLMHACFHAQENIVEYLLDKGADPNFHADSVTPIMAVCSNSSASNQTIYNIVTNLINKKAILNIGDKYGQTPLMRAISSGRMAVVEKLIELKVNIEMRDQQGWTAVFWAVHHNRPEILLHLIEHGARLNEVDKSNRRPLDIAMSHEYENITNILTTHLKVDENDEGDKDYIYTQVMSWRDFYPGIKDKGSPDYVNEIPRLLYGMNCEKLATPIMLSDMDLRTFLLLEEDDMIKLGIEMPYERQRLIVGLRNFHKRGWKLNAVAGLYARKSTNFTVLDCLTALGSHLQQIYILEASLQYTIREYNKVQDQIKFEPPDSPVRAKMTAAAKKMVANINNMREEMMIMKNTLNKISKKNPYPANLIKDKSAKDLALGYITEAAIVCSVGFIMYQAKSFITSFLKK